MDYNPKNKLEDYKFTKNTVQSRFGKDGKFAIEKFLFFLIYFKKFETLIFPLLIK